jgi:hypothetical protein
VYRTYTLWSIHHNRVQPHAAAHRLRDDIATLRCYANFIPGLRTHAQQSYKPAAPQHKCANGTHNLILQTEEKEIILSASRSKFNNQITTYHISHQFPTLLFSVCQYQQSEH